MNIGTKIKKDLWDAVREPYESNLYKAAVLEAIHFLSNTLRERADVDGDGPSLVGEALGGDSPRLKINKFQTETEKNEQKGLVQILRGIYQGIRNPRSHEQFKDTKDNADAIILFINYLLGIISIAKEPFTIEVWMKKISDRDFVASERYAELLISEVPPKKYNEALITIYRRKSFLDCGKLYFIFNGLVSSAGEDKIEDFLAVVSEDLQTTQDDDEVKRCLQVLPEHLWPRISEVARLRIENKLIKSIATGKRSTNTKKTEGWLGTWGRDFFKYFSSKYQLFSTLLEKLQADEEDQDYVAEYFLRQLPDTLEPSDKDSLVEYRKKKYISAILKAVSNPNGPSILRDKFLERYNLPEDWQKIFLEEIESVKEKDPEFFEKYINPDDNIPF